MFSRANTLSQNECDGISAPSKYSLITNCGVFMAVQERQLPDLIPAPKASKTVGKLIGVAQFTVELSLNLKLPSK